MDEVLEIQEPQLQEPDPPKKKLWKNLADKKLYTKSYEDFDKQFSTPESIYKLYGVLTSKQLYTKSQEDFKSQFFQTEQPKKKSARVDFEGSSLEAGNALSQSGGVGGSEIPTVEMYTTPSGEMVEAEPLSLAKKYKELNERQTKRQIDLGNGFSIPDVTKVEDENAKKEAAKLKQDFPNIDFEGINEDVKGLNDDLLDNYKRDILPDKETNNQLYQRKLSNIKWRSGIEKSLLGLVDSGYLKPDDYNNIKSQIDNIPVTASQGDYTNQRDAIKSVSNSIQLFGGENKDEILKNFAVEAAKIYGNPFNKTDKTFKDTPESKYLNDDAQLGYQYLSDLDPQKAEQYKRLFIDKNLIKDDPDQKAGYDHLMLTLEETGLGLKQNAITEEFNSLNKLATQQGGLSPDQIERAKKLEDAQSELTQKREELDHKYPERIENKVDDALQEIMGQNISGGRYAAGKAWIGIRNTGQGIWEAVSSPFMSDQSNILRELGIMGEGLEEEKVYHKTDKNKNITYDEMVFQPELQKQIDAIKNNGLLNDQQKENKLYTLLKENTDQFGRVPIKGGKFNLSGSSILYGLTDLGTSLLPFVGLEAATGGIGGAGAGAKFLRTFTAAAATTFHDEYANAIAEGKPQSEAYKSAMISTGINSLAMAGAGTPTEIRAMANPKTSAGKLILSMSDDAINAELKKGIPKGMKAVAENIKGRLKELPQQFKEGAKTGAKFEAYMAGANALNGREQDFKRSLLAIGEFGLMGAGLGQLGYKSPTQLQKSAGLEFGKKPEEFKAIADAMRKDGQLNETEYNHRVDLIDKYKEAYKSLPKANAKGKELSPKEQEDYLYNTVIKNEGNIGKTNLPPKQAEKAEKTAMVADHKNDLILEPKTLTQLESRKSQLEKQIEKKDENGKSELTDKERKDAEAELEAINQTIKEREDTTKSKEKLPKLSEPIEGVDEFGVPIGENVPPEVKGQPEQITQPIELSVEQKTEKNEKTIIKQGENKSNEVNIKALDEKTITKKFNEIDHEAITDPYDNVLSYFGGNGKISPSSISELFGGKDSRIRQNVSTENEKRARISLIQKDAPTIDKLAHLLWEKDKTGNNTTQDYKDAIENVLLNYNSKSAMMKDLVERYDLDAAYQKYLSQHGEDFSNIYDGLTESEMNHILQMEAEKKSEEEISNYIDSLIELNEPVTEPVTKPIPEVTETAKEQGVKEAVPEGDIETGRTEPEGTAAVLEGAGKGITHAANEVRRQERGMPEYQKNPESFEKWNKEAEELLKNGYDVEALMNRIEKDNHDPTPVENEIRKIYYATIDAEIAKNPTDKLLALQKRLVQVGDLANSRAGRNLVSIKGQGSPLSSISDFYVAKMEAAGVEKLTDAQKEEVKSQYEKVQTTQEEADAKIAKLQEENAKLLAELEIRKAAKSIKKQKKDYTTEREQLKNSIKEKWKNAGKDILSSDLPYRAQLFAIAPDVAKLMKSYIEEGITEFGEIIKRLHETVKEVEPRVTEKDIADILSGKYDVKKETKGDLLAKLRQIKNKKSEEAIKILARIRSGDFAEPKKSVSWVDNPELKKKYPKEYNEALDAIKAKEDARHEFDIALLRDQMSRRGIAEKATDILSKSLGTVKAITTGIDDSAVAIQTYVSMLVRPRTGAAAFYQHIRQGVSQKKFDRWLSALHNSPDFKEMKEMSLDVTEPSSLKEREKEEIFSNRFSGTIKIKGKEYKLLDAPLKPFERAFTTLGNVTRVVGYRTISQKYKREGYTPEKDPELFKSLAKRLNTETGRGTVNEYVDMANKVVTMGIWSPKLMAQKFNILGVSDLASLVLSKSGTKGYYRQLAPKERLAAIKDVAQFATTVMALSYGFALAFGGDLDADPLSSTFMDIKLPNGKSYNFTGGFSSYIRYIAQFIAGGKRFDGKFKEQNRLNIAGRFARSKTPPVTGALVNLAGKEDFMGRPTSTENELVNLAPISLRGIANQIKEDGAESFFTQGIPTFFGLNVKSESDYQKAIYEANQSKKKKRSKKAQKPVKKD